MRNPDKEPSPSRTGSHWASQFQDQADWPWSTSHFAGQSDMYRLLAMTQYCLCHQGIATEDTRDSVSKSRRYDSFAQGGPIELRREEADYLLVKIESSHILNIPLRLLMQSMGRGPQSQDGRRPPNEKPW